MSRGEGLSPHEPPGAMASSRTESLTRCGRYAPAHRVEVNRSSVRALKGELMLTIAASHVPWVGSPKYDAGSQSSPSQPRIGQDARRRSASPRPSLGFERGEDAQGRTGQSANGPRLGLGGSRASEQEWTVRSTFSFWPSRLMYGEARAFSHGDHLWTAVSGSVTDRASLLHLSTVGLDDQKMLGRQLGTATYGTGSLHACSDARGFAETAIAGADESSPVS